VPPGFRNNRARDQRIGWDELALEYRWLAPGRYLVRDGVEEGVWEVADWCPPALTLVAPSGLREPWRVVEGDGRCWVHGPDGAVALTETPRFPAPGDAAVKGGLLAPMPGKVVRVAVQVGEAVTRGQVLLVLEAMKMEQSTVSPAGGVVKEVLVREGEQVTAGQILAVVE
jgi:propionyl-CoA carboxylase alpha chain